MRHRMQYSLLDLWNCTTHKYQGMLIDALQVTRWRLIEFYHLNAISIKDLWYAGAIELFDLAGMYILFDIDISYLRSAKVPVFHNYSYHFKNYLYSLSECFIRCNSWEHILDFFFVTTHIINRYGKIRPPGRYPTWLIRNFSLKKIYIYTWSERATIAIHQP